MTAVEKVLSIARAELGYREKAGNTQLDDKTANAGSGNYTKYARDLDALTDFYNGPKQGYAWCDVFVDWCFYKAFGAELAKQLLCQPDRSAGAGCTYSLNYYRSKGRFHLAAPQPGDQIFFGTVSSSNHTGLVTDVGNGRVYTIEGNSSDGVYERSYALGASGIAGYGRPDWSLAEDRAYDADEPHVHPEENPSLQKGTDESGIRLPEVYKGCISEAVRAAQLLLIGRGFTCGPDGADGEFGPNTKTASLQYQQLHGLAADGIIGSHTWTSLLTRQ